VDEAVAELYLREDELQLLTRAHLSDGLLWLFADFRFVWEVDVNAELDRRGGFIVTDIWVKFVCFKGEVPRIAHEWSPPAKILAVLLACRAVTCVQMVTLR
jgi:hypothetical protein